MAKPFNGLSPAQAERLAMLAEEAGEIVMAVGKVLRHGYESTHPNGGPTNRTALGHEVSDLHGVAGAMLVAGDIRESDGQDHGITWVLKQRCTHHQKTAK